MVIAEKFSSMAKRTLSERKASPLEKVFKFNSFVKANLITNYVAERSTVLDLGCGKGGDLSKFSRKNLNSYTGIDFSEDCICEAKRRLKRIHEAKHFTFIVDDCYEDEVKSWGTYDVITSFFSFHFAFQNVEIAKRAIKNVHSNLVRGGKFIAILPNKVKMIEAAASQVKNPLFRIENYDGGNRYEFSFTDGSINQMPEYLLDEVLFMHECNEIGLVPVFIKSALYYGEERLLEDPGLAGKMHVEDLSADEKQVVDLYNVVCLEKKV